jgi:hypothetical protein
MSTRIIKLTEENIQYMREHYFDYPAEYFAKKFNTTKAYIQSRASVLGITKLRPTLDEEGLIEDYRSNTMTLRELEMKYHICRKKIRNIIKNTDVEYRTKSISNMRYKINTSYFEKIDTPNKAYMLGFIYADGNVYKSHLKVDINKKDESLLLSFLQEFESEHRIYSYKNNRLMAIVNEKIVNDLFKLGVFPRKTWNMHFPTSEQVPDELISHFIRGFFDGDGSIQYHQYKSPIWRFTFIAPNDFAQKINDILYKECGLKMNLLRDKRFSEGLDMETSYTSSTIGEVGIRPLKKVYDYFYGKNNILCLERKKIIFEQIFEASLSKRYWVGPKKCMYNGVIYTSITDAARKTGIPYSTMRYKCSFIE